ncbi:hypothetical protein GWK47_045373 [Chionoecetes opilio]|uniref:GIY-YIG domain-containing protein n=1 Tax=Chionoecetes opilio TaxID=41210 RepID=A0A8J4YEW5_CHIOP|nr:hypothetical protein GWK47_045373 [Chionoecetes opilio]
MWPIHGASTASSSPPSQTKETTQRSHVVYTITCKRGNCEVLPSSYFGMTTTKLSRRLPCHLTSGAPKSHLLEKHGIIITRKFLEENTELVDICADVRRLPILEALYIKDINPKLNVQAYDLQALPSMKRTAKRGPTRRDTKQGRAEVINQSASPTHMRGRKFALSSASRCT